MGSPVRCEENDEPGSPTVSDGGKPTSTADTNKIVMVFHATGNAPILKNRKWSVRRDQNVACLNMFLKKLLKLQPSDSLFLYVNQAFAPAPDEIVQNLYDCFGVDGALNIHYCKAQAWG